MWFLRKTFLTRIMLNGRNGKMGNTIGSHRERWKSNELHHPSCLIQVSLSMPYLIFSISKNLKQQTEEDPPSVHYINWLKNHGVSQVIRWDLLNLPRIRSKHNEGVFSYCLPVLWNKLPVDLRSITSVHTFKNRLKTFFPRTDLHLTAVFSLHALFLPFSQS